MSKKVINDLNIDSIEKSENISILKFSAEWCGPCQMFKGVYEEAALKNDDIIFGDVDIDDNESKKIVAKYNVNSVPTTIFFKNGTEVERFSGYLPLEEFINRINKVK